MWPSGVRCGRFADTCGMWARSTSLRTGNTSPRGGYDDSVRIWNLATGKPLVAPLRGHGTGAVGRFSRDGKSLFTVGEDGTARVWHVRTGREMLLFREQDYHRRYVSAHFFS